LPSPKRTMSSRMWSYVRLVGNGLRHSTKRRCPSSS
jgi:hypothetical protein